MIKKKPDLSIIILNYNTKALLRDCLRSIEKAKTDGLQFETIVIDNASTDGSVTMVEKEFSQVKLIKNKKNLGFAAGNNIGLRKAKGRYLLLLNPDTVVQVETLKVMIEFMDKSPRVGAATCRIELPDGGLDYSCHRGFPSPWSALAYFTGLAKIFPRVKFLTGYTLSHLSLKETHEVDAGCGAFLMIRREAGEAINWLDEDYFWYGEDLDFCYRLKQEGWQIMFVPETKITHHKGAASGIRKHSHAVTTATNKTKEKATRASTEVMRIFYQKHYQDKYPRPIYWLVMKGINLLERLRLAKLSV